MSYGNGNRKIRDMANAMANATRDAPGATRYKSWALIAVWLYEQGYTTLGVETIMRSDWPLRAVARHRGTCTAKVFEDWFDSKVTYADVIALWVEKTEREKLAA